MSHHLRTQRTLQIGAGASAVQIAKQGACGSPVAPGFSGRGCTLVLLFSIYVVVRSQCEWGCGGRASGQASFVAKQDASAACSGKEDAQSGF